MTRQINQLNRDPIFIGLLSGTSMDAIDAAAVVFKRDQNQNSNGFDKPELLATLSFPIPSLFRNKCLEISQWGRGSIDDYGHLDVQAGELFSEAVLTLLQQAKIDPKTVRAIGSHGQTLRHKPNATPPYSLQIGDPNIIAERTNIPTIADFRRRDLAAGGQGAPLAPAFHAAVFGCPVENRVIVNIGGIANLSIIPKDPEMPLMGFDSGPGNCLMDAWARQNWNIPFDMNGAIAKTGHIQEELLKDCLNDPYFRKDPPKSTGREYFNLGWLAEKMPKFSTNLPPKEIQATLLSLTAHSIADAIRTKALPDSSVFVCGGGAHNTYLMLSLSVLLDRPVRSTEDLGFPPDWIEAVLFAWLAKQTLEGKSGNCPTVTGARHATPLGGIFGFCPT